MKPPFAYFGGKTTLAPKIAALLPPHRHYVEPFCGSLAVLLAKEPTRFETVNDLDEDLMVFWRVLRDRGDELVRACALTPHGREDYVLAQQPVDDELERARRVWTVISQGRAGTLRKTGWRYFSKPVGGTSMPNTLDAYVQRMEAAVDRLRLVSLECRPALEVIADYGRHEDVCMYVDPPYEGATRDRSYGYRREMRSGASHRELAEALFSAASVVVVSGYQSPMYDELYDSWDRVELGAYTTQGIGPSKRTEILWSNRVLARPKELELR